MTSDIGIRLLYMKLEAYRGSFYPRDKIFHFVQGKGSYRGQFFTGGFIVG